MCKSLLIAVALLTSACATQEPAPVLGHRSIPDVKACIAEYEPEGFIGTREEYNDGCYKFAAVRF